MRNPLTWGLGIWPVLKHSTHWSKILICQLVSFLTLTATTVLLRPVLSTCIYFLLFSAYLLGFTFSLNSCFPLAETFWGRPTLSFQSIAARQDLMNIPSHLKRIPYYFRKQNSISRIKDIWCTLGPITRILKMCCIFTQSDLSCLHISVAGCSMTQYLTCGQILQIYFLQN